MELKNIGLNLIIVAVLESISLIDGTACEIRHSDPVQEFTRFDLRNTYIPQRNDFLQLPINRTLGEIVSNKGEAFEVDGHQMHLQPVFDDFSLSFYHATGLDLSNGFGHFSAFSLFVRRKDEPIVRLAIFNEIGTLIENKVPLLPYVKNSINYGQFEQTIKEIEKLEEYKKWAESKLKELNAEIIEDEKGKIGSASKNLYEMVSRILGLFSDDAFQNLSQRKEDAFQNLLENATKLKAVNVYLDYFNDGNKRSICLKRTEKSDTQHLTLIDALCFFHNLGLRIFTLEPSEISQNKKKKLQLFHSFIPEKANRIAYLAIEDGRFSALLPE